MDKTEKNQESVTALIEVRIAPQSGTGYERIAQRICQYETVDSLYLMTGCYDLLVTISGSSMQEVAEFVYEHLATIEGVAGTATHFVMKKYKENGQMLVKNSDRQERIKFV